MMKVKVSSKVVELLEKVNDMNYDEIEHKVYNFMYCLRQKHILSAFFKQNNLTVQKVIDCFENGYEVEYEFQKSDSVFYKNKLCYIDTLDSFKKWCNLSEYNTGICHEDISFKELKLFCKEENREDLKHE